MRKAVAYAVPYEDIFQAAAYGRGAPLWGGEAAIGESQLSGKVSAALRTKTGVGMISVRIDRALMPGSKTPKPPAVQIHFWPGCQRRVAAPRGVAGPCSGA